jgi:phosphotransferase system HPr (HPr) family protein
MERTYIIPWPAGLHIRPAARLARVASLHPGPVEAVCREVVVNAKDHFDLLLLAAGPGDTVTFRADGPEAGNLLERLTEAMTG